MRCQADVALRTLAEGQGYARSELPQKKGRFGMDVVIRLDGRFSDGCSADGSHVPQSPVNNASKP